MRCYVLLRRVVVSVDQRSCVCLHGLWQPCQMSILLLKPMLVVMSKVLLLYLLYFLWFCLSLFFDDFCYVCLKPCRTYSDVAISSSLSVVLAVFCVDPSYFFGNCFLVLDTFAPGMLLRLSSAWVR